MNPQNPVRVRFAPSPTGYLHVGGARTALFNWLYARSQGGVFVLRIEDTDRQRSTEQAYAAILAGMRWLGLDWDEGPEVGGDLGPYLQSERRDLYREQLDRLLASGQVYPCFCTDEELAERKQAAAPGGKAEPGYDGHCRDLGPAEREALAAAGRQPCWRLRTPEEGVTFWYDIVGGKREFQNETLTDRVVMKADGFPTYNFAAVVDDHLMGITHVLRGDDHVSNTPVQLLLYDACGFARPKLGHLPMILGLDKKRLSKRHDATRVESFREEGILPEAMVNYIALLGWSIGAAGDEVLGRDQLVKRFSLKKVNSSPAAFDLDKLQHINAEHIKRLSPARRLELAAPVLADHGWELAPEWRVLDAPDTGAYLARLLEILGNRFSSLVNLPGQVEFFFTDDFPRDPAAVAEHLASPVARERLAAVADALTKGLDLAQPVSADLFEQILRATAERLGVKAGELIHPCRVALTGQTRSAGIFAVMELIGGPRVVSRLRAAASLENS